MTALYLARARVVVASSYKTGRIRKLSASDAHRLQVSEWNPPQYCTEYRHSRFKCNVVQQPRSTHVSRVTPASSQRPSGSTFLTDRSSLAAKPAPPWSTVTVMAAIERGTVSTRFASAWSRKPWSTPSRSRPPRACENETAAERLRRSIGRSICRELRQEQGQATAAMFARCGSMHHHADHADLHKRD